MISSELKNALLTLVRKGIGHESPETLGQADWKKVQVLAIEQGLVDGAENNWPSYEAMRHYIVARYYTIDEHTRVPELQICSKAVWDKLSESDQQIIEECARESALYERVLWEEREKSSREVAEKSGITVIEL